MALNLDRATAILLVTMLASSCSQVADTAAPGAYAIEITPALAAQVKIARRLSNDEMNARFGGNTLTGEDISPLGRGFFSIYVSPSGEARSKFTTLHGRSWFDAGHYTHRGDQVCSHWQWALHGQERCGYIVELKDRYFYVDAEGNILNYFLVRPGDPDSLFPSVSQALEAERRKAEASASSERQSAAEALREAEDRASRAAEEERTAAAELAQAAEERRTAANELKKAAALKAAAAEEGTQRRPADKQVNGAPQGRSFEALGPLPRTENRLDWQSRVTLAPLQEQQVCAVVEKFYRDLDAAKRTRNEIKQNLLYKQRQEDLAALLPNGEFQGWVARAVEVTQAIDGSAAVVLQLPCEVLIGSNTCGGDPAQFQGTVPEDSPLYREFAKFDVNDFVIVSGALVAITEPKFGPLPTYRFFPAGAYCRKLEAGTMQDLFVVQLKSIFKMRDR